MIRKWYTLLGDPIKVFYSPGWVHMHGIVEPKDARIELVDKIVFDRVLAALRTQLELNHVRALGTSSKMKYHVDKQIDKIIEGDSDEVQYQSTEGSRSHDTSGSRQG